MTHISNTNSSDIDCFTEHGSRPTVPYHAVVEKLVTENKNKNKNNKNINNLPKLKSKKSVKIGSFNTQTLQKLWKIPELIGSAERTGQEVICIQEHRFVHLNTDINEHNFGKWKLLTCSAWRNSMNSTTGGIGILINSRAIMKYIALI